MIRLKAFLLPILTILAAGCDKDNQNGGEPDSGTLTVNKTELSFKAEGESQTLYAECSVKPQVTSNVDWLKAGDVSLNLDSKTMYAVKLTAEANATEEERAGEVTISGAGKSAVVKVTQKGSEKKEDNNGDEDEEAVVPPVDNTPVGKIGETAFDAARSIMAGWNAGNSLEVPDGETAWGNPLINESLIQGVKEAGFNAVRIPCAWHSHLVKDEKPWTIDPAWMKRVKEVVDMVVSRNMYAILNIHWDGGWLELNCNKESMDAVAEKEHAIWTQIANFFKDYDGKLIFAGNNEMRNKRPSGEWWGDPNAGEREAMEKYNQTFINAVRATGGNNEVRNLAVQSWCTNPWFALNNLTLPVDPSAGHLFMEVHFYDPQEFTHQQKMTTWGKRKGFTASSNNQEDYVDDLFKRLKNAFVDKGIPVMLGEYGCVNHSLTDKNIRKSEGYYLEYVTEAAKNNGIVPVYWDNATGGFNNFGLFDRSNGSKVQKHMINGIMRGAINGKYPF